MYIQRTLGQLGRGAAAVVMHPFSSTAYAVGLARGAVRAGIQLVQPDGSTEPREQPEARSDLQSQVRRSAQPEVQDTVGPQVAAPAETVPAPKPGPNVAAAPQRTPEQMAGPGAGRISGQGAGEQFFTEPSAASRASEHGSSSAETDVDWREVQVAEEDAMEVDTLAGTTGAGPGTSFDTAEADLQQPDAEPLLDPGVAKSIISESKTLRRAAERNPE